MIVSPVFIVIWVDHLVLRVSGSCEEGWISYNQRCYKQYHSETYCGIGAIMCDGSLGGSLPRIRNQQDNDDLVFVMKNEFGLSFTCLDGKVYQNQSIIWSNGEVGM